ncbi:MAG: isoprenylcysteine carboxylmethyltransferase family protein [Nitrospirae bacterium]|nr:isoprenylcysteine carboxylmethyltransferase family protein [Nitrospirota bacterium]
MDYKNSLLVTIIFLAFTVLHSLFLTEWAKGFAQRFFGRLFMKVFYRFAYTCFSTLTLGVAVRLILNIPDTPHFVLPPYLKAVFIFLQIVGGIILILPFRYVSIFEFVGISQIYRYVKYKQPEGGEDGLTEDGLAGNTLIINGIYGVVRHPMYLGSIIAVTFSTYLTRNFILISLLSVLYFIFGSMLEEKRLIKQFGNQYIEYQKTVPRLLPGMKGLRELLSNKPDKP